jgi:hypothetical protein
MSNEMKFREDYKTSKSLITYGVIHKDDVVLSGGFKTREEAEDFRDNAYGGYYKDCIVKPIYRKLSH